MRGDAKGATAVTDTTTSHGGAVVRADGTAVGYLGARREEGSFAHNVALLPYALDRTLRRTGLRLTLLTAPLA